MAILVLMPLILVAALPHRHGEAAGSCMGRKRLPRRAVIVGGLLTGGDSGDRYLDPGGVPGGARRRCRRVCAGRRGTLPHAVGVHGPLSALHAQSLADPRDHPDGLRSPASWIVAVVDNGASGAHRYVVHCRARSFRVAGCWRDCPWLLSVLYSGSALAHPSVAAASAAGVVGRNTHDRAAVGPSRTRTNEAVI